MKAPIEEERSVIKNGPDYFALAFSLKEPNRSPRKSVTFSVDSGRVNLHSPRNTEQSAAICNDVLVCICMLRQGNNADEFHFEGWIPGIRFGNIHGVYSSRTRNGWYKRGHRYSVFGGLKLDL